MALNFSSCSLYPTPVRSVEEEFVSSSRQWGFDSSCGGNSYWADWDAGGRWDYVDYGREADIDSLCDPAELLPADPFGMELRSTLTAALASCMIDLEQVQQDNLVAGLSYYWNQAFASELCCSSLGEYNPWMELGVSGLLFYNSQEEQEIQNLVPGLLSRNSQEEQEIQNLSLGEASCSEGGGEHAPHEGLFYALGYLGIRDILSVGMVCKSLRNATLNDPLLWRCIHIDSPMSEKLGDGPLFHLTQRAQGSLCCLSLVGCLMVTDEGLKHVLETNPGLKRLGIPGCLRISIEGLIKNLKAFKSAGRRCIEYLKLGRLFSVSLEQYEDLKALVGGDNYQEPRKPHFYHECLSSPLACDGSIDFELCPLCEKLKHVYDCPSESCQVKGSDRCRGCNICIARCFECGRCIRNGSYDETFCLEYVCSDCLTSQHQGPETSEETGMPYSDFWTNPHQGPETSEKTGMP